MSSRFTVVRDSLLGEQVWLATSQSGLRVRVAPMPRFVEVAAFAAFEYGSVDLGFMSNGASHASPEGTAHYLEHKLFEDEELRAFERFARRGARVNASTGFARTSYHFVASQLWEENLQDLLRLVSRVHLTDENVEKERGIIAQEIRMYEDSPDWRAFFDLIGCLYAQHPVRHPVGGTVESIAKIDKQELLACYDAFYRAGNAALVVVGPVDPERVLALADAAGLRAGRAEQRLVPVDVDPPVRRRGERTLGLARPRALLGYKDMAPLASPKDRRFDELVLRLLLDRLFSASSELKERLVESGVADDTLSASALVDRGFTSVLVHGESEEPERLLGALRGLLEHPIEIGDEHVERVRKKALGQHVRLFESVRSVAALHLGEAMDDLEPFSTLRIVAEIGAERLRERQAGLFRAAASAECVVT